MADAKYAVTAHDEYVVITFGAESLSSADVGPIISGVIADAAASAKNVIIHRPTPVVQDPSTADFYFFAKQLEEIRFRRKLALVFPVEMHEGNMEFFETAANNRGINLKLFASMEDAVQWIEDRGT